MSDPLIIVKVSESSTVVQEINTEKETTVVGLQGPMGPQGPGVKVFYSEKSADYYVNIVSDAMLGINCTSGDVNIYLPASSNVNQGQYVDIKKIDNTAYQVVVQTSLGQNIDNGPSTFIISDENEVYRFTSTGTQYKIS